ncbi:MAG: Bax inhibitor-1/YccA family protein [Chloroflexi bacterium]|nr:Bax inhibitor-1/YccA family protein [Chloroflexota bacterium]MCI0577473.1 Bax inhibitor-1/YccA family protein [Chloroflexota bacterium]MCI0647664.1 Bax inhibitor-1/YccA family protein [Chloroflexota bacterium]MCI0730094.1 Bax inhibitor-1/YccA family protein [Chloroflexota bacterium]
MNQDVNQGMSIPFSPQKLAETFTAAMQRVYLWMFFGLLLTTGVAVFVSSSETFLSLVFGGPVFLVLIFVELGLVLAISAAIHRLSPGTALALFFLYSAVNGLTLSVVFIVYNLGTIALAFGSTTLLFGIMSVIGFTTKEDLTRWGALLLVGLIGLIVASLVNLFLASSALDWIITYFGIGLFLALTAYDTQRIKRMTVGALLQDESTAVARIGILGALRLYLDFINLFLFILRLFGRRR